MSLSHRPKAIPVATPAAFLELRRRVDVIKTHTHGPEPIRVQLFLGDEAWRCIVSHAGGGVVDVAGDTPETALDAAEAAMLAIVQEELSRVSAAAAAFTK